ncbi:hypothetical protein LJC63_09695 [Ruminococcaceae bacterium OttesenSCG-928-L11]|nr:hypothetical protein [Ruminococcaceae bacterium OttesenSCG-928-L11]
MKKKSRVVPALLLAAMLSVSGFSGCGQTGGESAAPSQPASQAASSAPSSAAEAEPAEAGVTFPLAEPITLSAYVQVPPYMSLILQTFNDNHVFQQREKDTNIHFDFVTTELSVLLASDSLPDVFIEFKNYPGGSEKAVADNVLVALNDYMEYAPNYSKIMAEHPDIAKELVTDTGTITGFGTVQLGDEVPWYGPTINQNLLDELGLTMPETIDEWYDVLTAFKNAGVEQPLNPSATWGWKVGFEYAVFTGAYDVSYNFYNENGTAKYGPVEPGFKEFLTTFNKWYSEGLIDPDFVTPDATAMQAQAMNRQIGAMPYSYNLEEISAPENGAQFVAAPNPTLERGGQLHLRNSNFHNKRVDSFAISTRNKYVPETVAWVDYAYSDEGYLLYNYGIEGESWNWVDGPANEFEQTMLPQSLRGLNKHAVLDFSGAVNPGGLQDSELRHVYTLHTTVGSLRTPYNAFPEEYAQASAVWAKAGDDWYMPAIAHTADEAASNSAVFTDIETFVEESVIQFIIGTKDLSEFDAYVQQVKAMGLDTVLENKQAALDRYANR